MANEKLITLAQLGTVKTYIDANDSAAIKSVEFEENTLKFYTTADKSGAAAAVVSLPAEMVLDLTKTTLVNKFAWSESEYPGSTNPNLNNKPVLVLAVKTDTDPATYSYSFVAMADLVKTFTGGETNTATTAVNGGNISVDVKISAEAKNAVVAKSDGIYVETVDGADVSAAEGNILEKKADGLYAAATPINVSADSGNVLIKKTDGLYVPAPAETTVSAETGNVLVKKTDGLYVPTPAEVTVSTDSDNVLIKKDNGLYVPAPAETAVSADADNALVKKADGLFVSSAVLSAGIVYATDEEVSAMFS